MEFFLAKDAEITFSCMCIARKHLKLYSFKEEVPVKLEQCGKMEKHVGDMTHRLCSVLGFDSDKLTGFETDNPLLLDVSGDIQVVPYSKVRLGLTYISSVRLVTCEVNSFVARAFKSFTEDGSKQGERGICNAAIRVKVQLPGEQYGWTTESEKNIDARETLLGTTYGPIFNIDAVSEKTSERVTTGNRRVKGVITVILVLNAAAVNKLLVLNHHPSTSSVILRKMLQNEAEADTEILAGGHAAIPVKCHRAFLAARSPVFEAMFQSGMKEAATNCIRIPEMSESEVRALIKYLYAFDLEAPIEDSCMALEMLKAGNYYQVADLCEVIHELMVMKSENWFSVDVAVDMFMFTRDLCTSSSFASSPKSEKETCACGMLDQTRWKDLKMKAVQVLKWYSTEKPLDLTNSEKYKSAFVLHISLLKCLDMASDAMANF